MAAQLSQQGESTHGQLCRLFSQSPEPECIIPADYLADYKPSYPRIEEEVQQVLPDAQDFAARLDRNEATDAPGQGNSNPMHEST